MEAIVRPSSWNPLLFIHAAGAMALVATLIVAVYALRVATSHGDQPTTRFAFRALWMGVLPAYIAMRVGAQLIVDKEDLGDSNATWIGMGFAISDAGAVLLLVALILAGLAARKAARGTSVERWAPLRAATVLGGLLIAAYAVAIFAMTAKPD